MLISDLSSIRIHTTSCFLRLDVAPDHGCHVALVVHEASVEVWSFIWVRRGDVRAAAREGVLQEVKHAEGLPCGMSMWSPKKLHRVSLRLSDCWR